jgi:hypothetical protein
MLVDPSTGMIDFSKDKFDFSNDAWLQLQQNEIDPNLYGIPGKYSGLVSIVGKVCTDLAFILGNEFPIYKYAPLLDDIFKNNRLRSKQIEILNRISELMKTLDAENLSELQEIYNNTPDIQLTKTFDIDGKKPENKTNSYNTTLNKPRIEFANIPAGTFLMGSPDDEQERQGDEILHEVTLSALKMR